MVKMLYFVTKVLPMPYFAFTEDIQDIVKTEDEVPQFQNGWIDH